MECDRENLIDDNYLLQVKSPIIIPFSAWQTFPLPNLPTHPRGKTACQQQIKNRTRGDSMAVQWLGLSSFQCQRPRIQSLVGELRSCKTHGQKKKERERARELKSLKCLLYWLPRTFSVKSLAMLIILTLPTSLSTKMPPYLLYGHPDRLPFFPDVIKPRHLRVTSFNTAMSI